MLARRVDKRAVVAKAALIRAAERLFGEYGLDGVSMRQIAAAAGLSNNFAVQYHFGSKAVLLDAIFKSRLEELERRREGLFECALRCGEDDNPRVLADIIYRPITEIRDEQGRRTYAAFLLAVQQSAGDYWLRYQFVSGALIARRIKERLIAAAAHVPEALPQARRLSAAALVFSGLVQRDRQGRDLAIDAELIDDAIDAAAALLTAPVSVQIRTAVASPEPH